MSASSISLSNIRNAKRAISKVLPETPITFSPTLSERFGQEIYLKWENKLKTGSFKERGVCNFLHSLSKADAKRGVCAASAGNHALALSHHAARLRIPCSIVMPVNAPVVKAHATEENGAKVLLHGATFKEAYERAVELAQEEKLCFVPPFDDPRIINGQGTIGLEILDFPQPFDAVIVPIGGGGLISGVSTALKAARRKTAVIGVRSAWADKPAYKKAPRILAPRTIADGIAVKSIGNYCRPIIDRLVDDVLRIDEDTIAESVVALLEEERAVVEGSGAVPLGALIKDLLPRRFRRVLLLISGGNIDINLLSRLIDRELAQRRRLVKLRVSVPDRPGALNAVARNLASNEVNIVEVFHDRSFSREPGNVDLTLLVEVRDSKHRNRAMKSLRELGSRVVVE